MQLEWSPRGTWCPSVRKASERCFTAHEKGQNSQQCKDAGHGPLETIPSSAMPLERQLLSSAYGGLHPVRDLRESTAASELRHGQHHREHTGNQSDKHRSHSGRATPLESVTRPSLRARPSPIGIPVAFRLKVAVIKALSAAYLSLYWLSIKKHAGAQWMVSAALLSLSAVKDILVCYQA